MTDAQCEPRRSSFEGCNRISPQLHFQGDPAQPKQEAMISSVSVEQILITTGASDTSPVGELSAMSQEELLLAPAPAAGSATKSRFNWLSIKQRVAHGASRQKAWPDCSLSAGHLCRDKTGADCCWLAIGAAAKVLESVLPRITKIIHRQGENFSRGDAQEDVPTSVRMLMVGLSPEDCRPVLAIIDPRIKVRKAIATSICKDDELKRDLGGVRILALKYHPEESDNATLFVLPREHESNVPITIWGDRGSLATRPFGFHVATRQGDIRTGQILFMTTIGGVLQIDGQFYGLTVAHAFSQAPFQNTQHPTEDSKVDNEYDGHDDGHDNDDDADDDDEYFDFYFPDEDDYNDDENDENLDDDDENEFNSSPGKSSTISSTTGSSKSLRSQLSSTQTKDTLPQVLPTLSSDPILSDESSFSHKLGELHQRGQHSDWRLIKFDVDAVHALRSQLSNPESPRSLDSPDLREFQSEKPLMEFDVCVWTGAGKTCGVLLPGSFYMKFPGLNDLLPTWTVHLARSLVRGDSGSWVFDASNSKLLGLIVAGHPDSRTAYLISAHSVFEDIATTVGKPRLAQNFQPAPRYDAPSGSQGKPVSPDGEQEQLASTDRNIKMKEEGERTSSDASLRLLAPATDGGTVPLKNKNKAAMPQKLEVHDDSEGLRRELKVPVDQGQWNTSAEDSEVQSMEIHLKQLEADNPSILTSMTDLASLYSKRGRFGEAEELQRKVLQMCRESLGEQHLETAQAMAALSLTSYKQGRLEVADSLRLHALRIYEFVVNETFNGLKDGDNINETLEAASRKGHLSFVELLIQTGADVNAQVGEFGNPLCAASSGGHQAIVELLLQNGADVNAEGGYDGGALTAASREGHQAIVDLLLQNGADVNAEGGYDGGPLTTASREGHQAIVDLLLQNGADVNAEGGYYGGALPAASLGGHQAIVKLLLQSGADVNVKGGYHGGALQAASARGHQAIVELLLQNGADVNAKGGRYGSALTAASRERHQAIVDLLLQSGADVNAEGGRYGSALHVASSEGHQAIVELLLQNGADVNAEGGYYGSALQAASSRGHQAIVNLLLQNGADVNAKGGRYGSALTAASLDGHQAIVKLLLQSGADVNVKGGYYGGALQAASSRGHPAIVELLKRYGAHDLTNFKGW